MTRRLDTTLVTTLTSDMRSSSRGLRAAIDRFVTTPLFGGVFDRWVLRQTAFALGLSLVIVVVIFVVIDFLTNYDTLTARVTGFNSELAPDAAHDTLLGYAGRYYLLNVPGTVYLFGPMIMLMAALFTVTRMVRHHEFVVAMTSGVSIHRALRSVFVVVLGLCAAMLAYSEWVKPLLGRDIDRTSTYAIGRDTFQGMLTDSDNQILWLKGFDSTQAQAEAVLLISYKGATLPGNLPLDPTTPILDRAITRGDVLGDFELLIVEGSELDYSVAGVWHVGRGNVRELGEGLFFGEPYRSLEVKRRIGRNDVAADAEAANPNQRVPAAVEALPTELRPGEVGRRKLQVLAQMSTSQLLRLSAARPEWEAPAVQFHQSIIYPLAPLILCLLGISLLLDTENPNAVRGLGVGLLLCMAFYAIFVTLQGVGLRGELSSITQTLWRSDATASTQVGVAVVLWGGNGVFGLYGLYRFRRMRS